MPKIAKPLTNTEIERAKPKTKEFNLVDGNGLALRVKPTGLKSWILNYISPVTSKRTNLSLGRYPEITLAQARIKREEYRALLAQGIDPQIHISKQAHEEKLQHLNTFQAIAENWRAKKQIEIEAKTLAKYWRGLETYILPYLGKYPIQEITPPLVIPVLQKLEGKGVLYTISRLCGHINEILNFAVNGGLIPFNPCLKIAKTFSKPSVKNNPRIKSEELPEFMHALNKAKIEPLTKALIKFKLLTMVRSNEVCKAQWQEIDFNQKIWTIPAERMKTRKPHIVPLSSQVLQILAELQKTAGNSPYIFPKWGKRNAQGNNAEPMSTETPNTAIKRMGFQNRLTAHGLRGLARTYLAEQGIQYEHAEACLAHRFGSQVSLAYNDANYLEQRKEIMQLWGDFVEKCATFNSL